MYDRKVDGQVLDFVVSGKLWRRSLVMQDLQTKSLWSHLLGTCMEGSLQGKQLKQIPSVLTSWQSWRDAHPQTTVIALSPVVDYTNDMLNRPDELVLGLQLQGKTKAWTFVQLTRQPAIQDEFGGRPILVFYDRQVFSAAIFDRRLAGQTLTFGPPPSGQTHQLVDESTGSTWDMHNGLAIDGPLEGQRLQALPATVSYFHAWDQFHPNSEYWQAPN